MTSGLSTMLGQSPVVTETTETGKILEEEACTQAGDLVLK